MSLRQGGPSVRTRIATREYPSISSSYQDIPIVNCENPQRIILYVFTIADSHRLWNHKVTDRDTINLFPELYFNINKNHFREDIKASSLIVSYSVTIFTSTHSGLAMKTSFAYSNSIWTSMKIFISMLDNNKLHFAIRNSYSYENFS